MFKVVEKAQNRNDLTLKEHDLLRGKKQRLTRDIDLRLKSNINGVKTDTIF